MLANFKHGGNLHLVHQMIANRIDNRKLEPDEPFEFLTLVTDTRNPRADFVEPRHSYPKQPRAERQFHN